MAEHVYEHAALLDATLNRDAELAGRLAAEHPSHFQRAIRATSERHRLATRSAPFWPTLLTPPGICVIVTLTASALH